MVSREGIPWSAYVWGALAGAVVLAIVEFSFGWVMTVGGARTMATAAVQKVLVHGCAVDMATDPEALKVLATKQPKDYDDAVRDAWRPKWLPEGVAMPDGWDFRRACGKEVEAMLPKKAAEAK